MAGASEIRRKYLQVARVLTAADESILTEMSELIERGQQCVVLVTSRGSRETCDALTDRLITAAEGMEASVSVLQVGSARPKRWRKWLARLNATRALIVTPEDLGEPTVAMFWAPEVETGTQRLVLGEMRTLNLGEKDA